MYNNSKMVDCFSAILNICINKEIFKFNLFSDLLTIYFWFCFCSLCCLNCFQTQKLLIISVQGWWMAERTDILVQFFFIRVKRTLFTILINVPSQLVLIILIFFLFQWKSYSKYILCLLCILFLRILLICIVGINNGIIAVNMVLLHFNIFV